MNKNEDEILAFLKYITNNNIRDIHNNEMKDIRKWENETGKGDYQETIDNCNSFLEQIIKKENIKFDKIYEKTKIKEKFKGYKGLYVYSCFQIEKELVQLFIFLTGNNPIAQNILLCNKETSSEEITSFFYRALFCKYNSCFIIGGIESLNFNQKNKFIEILNQIMNKKAEDIKSCLIILSGDKSTDIYKELNSIQYRKLFDSKIEEELRKILINELDKVQMNQGQVNLLKLKTSLNIRFIFIFHLVVYLQEKILF